MVVANVVATTVVAVRTTVEVKSVVCCPVEVRVTVTGFVTFARLTKVTVFIDMSCVGEAMSLIRVRVLFGILVFGKLEVTFPP